MNPTTKKYLEHLWCDDRQLQNEAFFAILAETDQVVDWAYEAWAEVLQNLSHKDNHNRAIASQVLCNLAKSDPENRILDDFPALFAVTGDKRFVTARHTMQALWKIGALGGVQKQILLQALEKRFNDCVSEKNCTLIRFDILQSMRNVYDAEIDEAIREKALALIEREEDLKYRKKYAKLWKDQPPKGAAGYPPGFG